MSKKTGIIGLTLAAVGVVYGDIGTSPLYTINEIFFAHGHTSTDYPRVYGAISLVIWSLTLIVAIKYIIFVLKADYEGEGGVFALLGNINKSIRKHKTKFRLAMATFLIFGAGLIFGDGLITPAISVLSAVEGLGVIAPSLKSIIVPITIGILFGLFSVQKKGTSKVGKLFGPIIILWFITISVLGLMQIVKNPGILNAFNPYWAINFIMNAHLRELLLVMGSVMLAVTGGEALFADMGHFGKKPIRIGWFSAVYPALILSYLGQGAYLISGAEILNENIFFSMVPRVALIPVVALATCATVIASQALISGVFSLASQGVAFGLMPRLNIIHTNKDHEGQIYVPAINWALFFGCVALVLSFQSSTNLAAAYGLAVSIDMVMTSLCMFIISRTLWKWSSLRALATFSIFIVLELGFLIANSLKLFDGGYVPLGVGVVAFVVMTTWAWGRKNIKNAFMSHGDLSMDQVLKLKQSQKSTLQKSLLILSPEEAHEPAETAPPLLNLFIKRHGSLPDHTIVLNIKQVKSHAKITAANRFTVSEYQNDHKKGLSLLAITATYGFMETPDIKKAIKWIAGNESLTPNDNMKDWIIYAGRERLIIDEKQKLHHKFRANLFKLLSRNSSSAYSYFGLGEDLRVTMEMLPIKLRSEV